MTAEGVRMSLSSEDLRLAQLVWDYMYLCQEVSPSNVIIGLGCHDLTVADDVATLYHQGFAPLVVFSGNAGRMTAGTFENSEAQMMKDRAVKLGVPAEAILVEETSTNTGENIRMTQDLLKRHGVDTSKVILVHKPYMLRRDYATFMRQWQDAKRTDVVCWANEVTMAEYLKKKKLDARESIEIMLGDLQRIHEYPKLGFQIVQDIPDTVWRAYEKLVTKGYDTHLLK